MCEVFEEGLISKKKKKFRCSSFQEPPYGRRVAAFVFSLRDYMGCSAIFSFGGSCRCGEMMGKVWSCLGGMGNKV